MDSLSIAEAAQLLGVEAALVIRWIESGRLEAAWSFGPHGPQRSIERSAALAFQSTQLTPSAGDQASGDAQQPNGEQSLDRARAVQDYTAGLAATAIAPAVARLVETMERLIIENGNLREETGRLRAELAALNAGNPQSLRGAPAGVENPPAATGGSGLTAGEWSALEQRIDRLTQPPPGAAGEVAANPPPEASGGRQAAEPGARGPRRRRRTRLSAWLGRFLGRSWSG